MTVQVRLLFSCTLKEGKTEADWRELKDRAGAMVAEREPGTLVYNWWLGEDGNIINEDGFADEASFGAHMANMTETGLLDEYMGMHDIVSIQVLGEVSDETREGLAPLGAAHYTRIHER